MTVPRKTEEKLAPFMNQKPLLRRYFYLLAKVFFMNIAHFIWLETNRSWDKFRKLFWALVCEPQSPRLS